MALSDLMFRDNEKNRDLAIRLHQEIVLCIERNFNTTNKVSDICNKYLNTSFEHIKMNTSDKIEENCNILNTQISSIQKCLIKMDQELKDALEPEVYRLLCDVSVSVSEKQLALSKHMKKIERIGHISSVIAVTVIWPVLSVILCKTVENINKVAACCFGALPVTLFFGAIAILISYFAGKKEREVLDKAIKEYKEVLSHLNPNTERYQFAVMKACIKLDIPWEK
ncbi:single-pass membrane and coiled-coil domain-containing protein 3-like [Protopterus annectens]|uniref:single-pass membrane and coiled-coil domain-containing protein 3-like n=1 Tax=Protopterus annectens TaxID=7888 RepID=UPI001CF96FAC|nr:single-pass membrane and coiled-coil domain-containing protein 3-like [Protopterus annectens]